MSYAVYMQHGICVRDHWGAEPAGDIEPSGLLTAVGRGDRAPTPYATANGVEALASATRGWFRGIHGGRTAPPLPTETGAISGSGRVVGSVSPVLVRSH